MFALSAFMPDTGLPFRFKTHGTRSLTAAEAGRYAFSLSIGKAVIGQIVGVAVFLLFDRAPPWRRPEYRPRSVTIGGNEAPALVTQEFSASYSDPAFLGVYSVAHNGAAADIEIVAAESARCVILPFTVSGQIANAPHDIAATDKPENGLQITEPAGGAALYMFASTDAQTRVTWKVGERVVADDEEDSGKGLGFSGLIRRPRLDRKQTVSAFQRRETAGLSRWALRRMRARHAEAMVGLSWR